MLWRSISNATSYSHTLPYPTHPTLKEYGMYELLHRSPSNLPSDLRDRYVPFLSHIYSHLLLFSWPQSLQFISSLILSLDFKPTVPSFRVPPIIASKIRPTPEILQGETIVSPAEFPIFHSCQALTI